MTFGARLRKARQQAQLTQKALERRSGVSQKTISKIERGEQASSGAIVQLAQACGVRPEWLATGEEPMQAAPRAEQRRASYLPLSEEAVEIARAWQSLPKRWRERLREQFYFGVFVAKLSAATASGGRTARTYREFEERLRHSLTAGLHPAPHQE